MHPMRGPEAQAVGTAGEVRIGGLRAASLTKWRVVLSPRSTPERVWYTLFGEGTIGRFYAGAVGCRARATLTPSSPPARIGRKKVKAPGPFALEGVIVELSVRQIVIAEGTTGPP